MFRRAIISGMAVSPEDLAAGALALQTFIKNAQYVEIIVNVAFGAIPSILGIGAAGLIGHGIINTAKEVRNSISLLKTVGPGLLYGTAMAGKGLNIGRKAIGERLQQSDNKWLQKAGNFLWKKQPQDTQGKQDEKGGGGSGGSPPVPPNTKISDKKEQNNKAEGPRPLKPSYGFSDSLLVKIFKRDSK
jgi:hypothetical protein